MRLIKEKTVFYFKFVILELTCVPRRPFPAFSIQLSVSTFSLIEDKSQMLRQIELTINVSAKFEKIRLLLTSFVGLFIKHKGSFVYFQIT